MISKLLTQALRRKRANNPGYSLRALARDIGVSPAFASMILTGKRAPPTSRIEDLCYTLELDVLERRQIVEETMLNSFGKKALAKPIQSKIKKKSPTRKTTDSSSKSIVASWINLAVLEGLTLAAPFCNLERVRERLQISDRQLQTALRDLTEAGLIEQKQGRWQKKDDHLYVAGGRSRKEIREFHDAMIGKARTELMTRTSQADYNRRLINGMTFAVNPEHIDQLKAKMIQFMNELALEAGTGKCTDVYQCNFQLFPLTQENAE